MQWCRPTIAAQPRGSGEAGCADRDVESVLQRHLVADAEPTEQILVRRTAPQENVLTVVDVEIAPTERVSQTAELRPCFVQRDVQTGIGAP
jgi:hypothetical protein